AAVVREAKACVFSDHLEDVYHLMYSGQGMLLISAFLRTNLFYRVLMEQLKSVGTADVEIPAAKL
ncbi:hypothetical protein ACJX0J_026667, partial [Zea mays]